MFNGKPCSWVRDNFDVNISAAWGANYRDTFILDPLNGKIEAYNLTAHDLSVAANRAELKSKLIAAATPADSDGDKIPDYWEMQTAGSLALGPGDLAPHGEKLLHAYALCSTPVGGHAAALRISRDAAGVTLRCIRRRGLLNGLVVAPEIAGALDSWGPPAGFGAPVITTLYDGSGGELVEWRNLTTPPPGQLFARLKIELP
jgi:hypothetical protein